jgi:hypothetical protein
MLGVDVEYPRAVRLYEVLGFSKKDRSVRFQGAWS